jgi:hypothetical protein
MVERFFKSPIDKAVGSGCGACACAACGRAVAVSLGAVVLADFFKFFFFVAIVIFS